MKKMHLGTALDQTIFLLNNLRKCNDDVYFEYIHMAEAFYKSGDFVKSIQCVYAAWCTISCSVTFDAPFIDEWYLLRLSRANEHIFERVLGLVNEKISYQTMLGMPYIYKYVCKGQKVDFVSLQDYLNSLEPV